MMTEQTTRGTDTPIDLSGLPKCYEIQDVGTWAGRVEPTRFPRYWIKGGDWIVPAGRFEIVILNGRRLP